MSAKRKTESEKKSKEDAAQQKHGDKESSGSSTSSASDAKSPKVKKSSLAKKGSRTDSENKVRKGDVAKRKQSDESSGSSSNGPSEAKSPKVDKSPASKDDLGFIEKIEKRRKDVCESVAKFKFNKKRVRVLSKAEDFPDDSGGVVYWMSRDQRVQGQMQGQMLGSVRHLLSTEATKTLVCAFVLSRLDYANSLLSGCPQYLLDKLQRVQNTGARLVAKTKRKDHISPVLQALHWLPVRDRVNYKILSVCHVSLSSTGPSYLSDLLHLYTPPRQLRSSSDTRILTIPSVRTKTFGQRSFAHQGPVLWNVLPRSLRHTESSASFKHSLKTFLFRSSESQ